MDNYKRALEIKSEPSFVLGNFIHTKTRMCEWDNFQNDILEFEIENAQKSNEHVENFAREKLNLVYPDEEFISFKDEDESKDDG